MPADLLQIEGLSKAFGDRAVIRNISLSVAENEIVAVVGRSGCGKSTLLRLIAGLETPDSGAIRVRGELVTGLNVHARMVFQDAALLPWRTVLQNVLLALPDGKHRAAARAALAHVGLADRGGDWPSVLSGGQRQRVALARALASNADLILLDEPLGALDALTRLEMQDLIERLWTVKPFTAVLITHDVEEAVALADRVFVMDDGLLAHEVPVRLPRPHARGDRAFVALRERILERVLTHDTIGLPQEDGALPSPGSGLGI